MKGSRSDWGKESSEAAIEEGEKCEQVGRSSSIWSDLIPTIELIIILLIRITLYFTPGRYNSSYFYSRLPYGSNISTR